MTPAEVLAAHQHFYRVGWARVEACTGCKWTASAPNDTQAKILHAAHVLDALTKAGHVVVTLPEGDENGEWFPNDSSDAAIWVEGGVIEGRHCTYGNAAETRAIADALYSAAAAAETGGKA